MKKKEYKKRQQQFDRKVSSNNNEIKTGMIILLALLLIFGSFYLVTAYLKGEIFNNKKTPNAEEEVEIQYTEILAGTTFNQTSKEYYVLFVAENHNKVTYFQTLVNNYTATKDHLPVYFVDTANSFNTKYITEDINYVPTGVNDLKVNSLSLIKVKDKKVEKYITGEEKIVEHLKSLVD